MQALQAQDNLYFIACHNMTRVRMVNNRRYRRRTGPTNAWPDREHLNMTIPSEAVLH
jgi:hypothetical protein